MLAMLSEAGHYTGTFRLARSLRDRGHRIVYLGIADFEPLVKSQGFAFVPFAADLLPIDFLMEIRPTGAEIRTLLQQFARKLIEKEEAGERRVCAETLNERGLAGTGRAGYHNLSGHRRIDPTGNLFSV